MAQAQQFQVNSSFGIQVLTSEHILAFYSRKFFSFANGRLNRGCLMCGTLERISNSACAFGIFCAYKSGWVFWNWSKQQTSSTDVEYNVSIE